MTATGYANKKVESKNPQYMRYDYIADQSSRNQIKTTR